MVVETDAIVLQTRKYSDSSKIVVLFSREFGKISTLAKGAYTVRSKFCGSLEPLSITHVVFYKKSNTELHLLKTSELIMPLNQIHKCSDALISGIVVAEFILNTQNESTDNDKLYNKLVIFLNKINENSNRAFGISIQFLIYLTDNMGFSVLEDKGRCGEQINKLIAENNLQTALNSSIYVEFISDFARFFSEHLGKKINIRAISLIE